MANLRITMDIDKQANSFTESYYLQGDASNLLTYAPLMTQLAQARMAFAGQECQIGYIRINNHDVPGQSWLLSLYATLTPIHGTGTDLNLTTVGSSDFQDTAAMARFTDQASLYRKNTYLRGMVDSQIQAGGTYAPDPNYRGKVNSYFTFLVNNHFGWLRASAPQKVGITGVVQNVNDGTVTITLQAPGLVGLVNGQRYQFAVRKVQGAYQVNGINLYNLLDATHLQSVQRVAIFPATALANAYVRYTSATFIGFATGQVMRIVERKAGRPSYQSRGRQRARARS